MLSTPVPNYQPALSRSRPPHQGNLFGEPALDAAGGIVSPAAEPVQAPGTRCTGSCRMPDTPGRQEQVWQLIELPPRNIYFTGTGALTLAAIEVDFSIQLTATSIKAHIEQ